MLAANWRDLIESVVFTVYPDLQGPAASTQLAGHCAGYQHHRLDLTQSCLPGRGLQKHITSVQFVLPERKKKTMISQRGADISKSVVLC